MLCKRVHLPATIELPEKAFGSCRNKRNGSFSPMPDHCATTRGTATFLPVQSGSKKDAMLMVTCHPLEYLDFSSFSHLVSEESIYLKMNFLKKLYSSNPKGWLNIDWLMQTYSFIKYFTEVSESMNHHD